jgi:pyruvate ferredoxin oxidoreductase gamma subunit
VLAGVGPHTVLLLRSAENAVTWRERLGLAGVVAVLLDDGSPGSARTAGAACAGAAARTTGVIGRDALVRAVEEEVGELGADAVAVSVAAAVDAFDRMTPLAGAAREGAVPDAAALAPPDWVELPLEPAVRAAPDVFATATSVAVRSGLWRTLRPVIDHSLCHRCTWVCVTACPDAAITRDAGGAPAIDYDHCKGCLVCVAVCPPHAIHAVPERDAQRAEAASR